MKNLKAIARPSAFTCPDCGGVLFEMNDKRPVRLRCHTGHAFALRSLACQQKKVSDAALWTSLRVLQETKAVLRRLAQRAWAEMPAGWARCRPTPACAAADSQSGQTE